MSTMNRLIKSRRGLGAIAALALAGATLTGCVYYPGDGYYAPGPVVVAPGPVVVGGGWGWGRCWGCGWHRDWR